MTEIERILSKYVSHGAEKDKLLGAAFIAVGKGGMISQVHIDTRSMVDGHSQAKSSSPPQLAH